MNDLAMIDQAGPLPGVRQISHQIDRVDRRPIDI